MKLKRMLGLLVSGCVAVGMLAGCGSTPTASENGATEAVAGEESTAAADETKSDELLEFNVVYTTWIGYGPLYIAKEKGFFAEHGIDPKLNIIEDEAQFAPGLYSDSIQAVGHAFDREIINYGNGTPEKTVFAMDQSKGGDGIIATADIKTMDDLKGKTIAIDKSSTSYFFFLTALADSNITEEDVLIQDMGAGDGGAAFLGGSVDAAVVWEPWLTNASQREGGHVLVSSADYPNTIIDVIAFNQKFVDEHPEAVKGFTEAWYEAVEYYLENVDEGNQIMADGLGLTVEDIADMVSGVEFYGRDENLKFFDKSIENNIFEVADRAAEFWTGKGLVPEGTVGSDILSEEFYK